MVGVVKDKTMDIFKLNKAKDYSKPTRIENVCRRWKKLRKPKIKKTTRRH